MTLGKYAGPIRSLPVDEISTEDVLGVLKPIWTKKPETASRLRGRIEAVLDWAAAKKLRVGDNPARWRGHLDHLLPSHRKVSKVKHHAALPFAELPAFMSELRKQDGISPRALEFAILTAGRTNEVIGARWSEIDTSARMWTVPPQRMKGHREHRVPLSGRVFDLLKNLPREGEFVFAGGRAEKPLSNMAMLKTLERMGRGGITTHGFRSSFRDWAAETTSYPEELCEMALAHAVSNKVEAAYRRGDMLEKRRQMMADWARFCMK
jgi:integrase